MVTQRFHTRKSWLLSGLILMMLLSLAACSPPWATSTSSANPGKPRSLPLLPGQQIWKNGVSSLLFGTNDTQEWDSNNIETNASFQQALRDAHFTLMRTFFFDKSLADNHPTSDAEIEQRLRTVENSGMTCLGVLFNIFNVAFMKHVVAYAGSRCLLYEFGNEPDYNGISSQAYLKQWNSVIPQLRHLNPQARFIGPAGSSASSSDFLREFLTGVKASGVLPDAISFHWYPCWQNSESDCLQMAGNAGQEALGVRALVRQVLGRELPVGITEWNYDPGNPPPAYGDNTDFMSTFTTRALQAMISAGVAFACQFDAASYGGYGRLDMFNISSNTPKPQYFAIKTLIAQYRPSGGAATSGSNPGPNPTSPLISRGKPVFCSANDGPGGPEAIVDGHYGNWAFWHGAQSTLPGWCAIHVGSGPTRLLFIWDSDYVFDYLSNGGSGPRNYSIAVSADSTDGADGTWKTLVTVTNNQTRNREHLLDFAGMSWVKMTVTGVQPQNSNHDFVVDEIDLFDVSTQTALDDSFFCAGASITATAFNRFDDSQPSLAEDVHAASPQYFPAMVNGGVGGWTSGDLLQNLGLLLSLNPDMHYWLIGVGTNDAFGNANPAAYRANLEAIVARLKQAGHVPIIAHIPYTNESGNNGQLNQEIQALNAVIDQVTRADHLIPGPDLYQLFRAHPGYLSSDGVHPNPTGSVAINRAWFEALRPYLWR
jgi:lysophospholipase L1-like esterase